jgi:phosphoribosylformimino-5-aminoimidazole carboxamide ribotide isomerase
MHIIPVIDVRNGQAVRAIAGVRSNYRPLTWSVGAGTEPGQVRAASAEGAPDASSPLAIARGYLGLYGFPILYIADLDGIEGRPAVGGWASDLFGNLPDVQFWIDAGQRSAGGGLHTTVIGSEALKDEDLRGTFPDAAVLSLDFREDVFLGPLRLLETPQLWPRRVIVMSLSRVGSNAGPDLERVADIVRRAPHAEVYAAGGIRDLSDVRAARAAGAAGILISSALHGEKIKADDLEEIIGL